MTISYDEFEKVDLRSGTVTKVEPFSRTKKPAYDVYYSVQINHEIASDHYYA